MPLILTVTIVQVGNTLQFVMLFSTVAQFMLREDTILHNVTEGEPGFNTSVMLIVDVMDGQTDAQLNFTVSSTATSKIDSVIVLA